MLHVCIQATLLASGRLMYHGTRDGVVEWFSGRLGYPYDPQLHGVVSDWALDLVAIGFYKPKKFYGHTITSAEELHGASAQFVAMYKDALGINAAESGLVKRTNNFGESMAAIGTKMGNVFSNKGTEKKYAAGPWRQYQSLLWRELLSITRNPADVAGRTLTFAWVAILMGLLYYSQPDNANSLRGRLNLLFNVLAFFCLMPYVSMSLYSADKKFYIADASAKLYRPLAYYLAKVSWLHMSLLQGFFPAACLLNLFAAC